VFVWFLQYRADYLPNSIHYKELRNSLFSWFIFRLLPALLEDTQNTHTHIGRVLGFNYDGRPVIL